MATPVLRQRLRYLAATHELIKTQVETLRNARNRLPDDLRRVIPNKFLASRPTLAEMRATLKATALQTYTRQAKGSNTR